MSLVPPPVTAAPTAPGRLPVLGHLHHLARRRTRLEFMDSLRRHGTVVRIALGTSYAYVITDAEVTRTILVSRESKAFVKGGKFFDSLRMFLGADSLGTVSDMDDHRRHRRLVQPMFNRAYIDGQGDVVIRRVRDLVESWPEDQPLEICEEMDAITLAAFLAALFGTDLPAEVGTEFRRLVPVMMRGTLYHTLLPSWVTKIPLPAQRRYLACRTRLRELVDIAIDAHQTRLNGHPDGAESGLFTTLLTARDAESGQPLSRTYLQDEVITLLFGAAESSSITLMWTLYEITRNPEIERRLRDELDTVCGDRPLRYADVPRLVYLRCVLQEALRHYGSPWILTRTTTEPVILDGHPIPAGADVIFSPYLLQHDPEVFPNPHVFDPERWHPDHVRPIPRTSRSLAFGDGRHKCIGEQFAWAEIPIILATILRRWQLERTDDREVRPMADVAIRPGKLFMAPHGRPKQAPTR
jgi:cytochrome P450